MLVANHALLALWGLDAWLMPLRLDEYVVLGPQAPPADAASPPPLLQVSERIALLGRGPEARQARGTSERVLRVCLPCGRRPPAPATRTPPPPPCRWPGSWYGAFCTSLRKALLHSW